VHALGAHCALRPVQPAGRCAHSNRHLVVGSWLTAHPPVRLAGGSGGGRESTKSSAPARACSRRRQGGGTTGTGTKTKRVTVATGPRYRCKHAQAPPQQHTPCGSPWLQCSTGAAGGGTRQRPVDPRHPMAVATRSPPRQSLDDGGSASRRPRGAPPQTDPVRTVQRMARPTRRLQRRPAEGARSGDTPSNGRHNRGRWPIASPPRPLRCQRTARTATAAVRRMLGNSRGRPSTPVSAGASVRPSFSSLVAGIWGLARGSLPRLMPPAAAATR